MRLRTAMLLPVVLAAGCGGGGKSTSPPPPPPTAPPPTAFQVTVTAATHRPEVGSRWHYEVRSARKGRLTVQILDPFGGVHSVDYDGTKKSVTNFPFKGVFRDYLEFPAESRGLGLVVRATVKAAGQRGVGTFWVKSR